MAAFVDSVMSLNTIAWWVATAGGTNLTSSDHLRQTFRSNLLVRRGRGFVSARIRSLAVLPKKEYASAVIFSAARGGYLLRYD